ncbi:hypothetical protein GGR44_000185 [Sphingobium fontiphilum]|uniref:Lipoprotein n=1 Tax=Sphingobium fontiphilum TaxID=944425 RepID=A0A7W6GP18_9SPHN|nr:hypothetical protein [Sphingobium fontiphilum]MBB3980554.1 hypothetical protein [Sphingobium fontiphilum]
MRAPLPILTLMLFACDAGPSLPAGKAGNGDDGHVACLIDGQSEWTRDCRYDQDGAILTLRHADGGFRRFRIVGDGRGLEPADGAEGAIIRIVDDGMIEVAVGPDRYRLPATMGQRR